MTGLRDVLTEQLAGKLDRHRVVVWTDPRGEYRDVAAELVPEGAVFEQYRSSWYELRRRIEPEFSRSEPRLLIYIDAKEPDEDPLAELRASGTRYTRQLGTLLRQTMEGELTAAKLDEIANTAATLVEVEALLAAGDTSSPARLLKVLGPHELTELVLKLATVGQSFLDDDLDLRDEVAKFLDRYLGLHLDQTDDLMGAIARHLVLVQLAAVVDEFPPGLRYAYHAVNAEQRRRCEAVLCRWKHDQRLVASFDKAMSHASRDLALSTQLAWHDALTELDTIPAYDELAFEEYLRRVDRGQFVEAEDLAAARLVSRWVEHKPTKQATQLWRVAHTAARLRRLIQTRIGHSNRSVEWILQTYADDTWQVDSAHRQLESALLTLTNRTHVETVIRDARQAYHQWLDSYLRYFTAAAENDGLANGALLLQGHIHSTVVARYAAPGPVAYFMVDALRYELAHDLRAALRQQFEVGNVQLRPAVGLVPSITPVGMANLCPGADEGLSLQLTDTDRLVVKVNGQEAMTPADRVGLLQAAHGKVSDLRLDDVFRLSEQELQEKIEGASLVLVRSQEIDEQGETGKLSIGLHGFEATVQHLSRAVARLAHHGLGQFVISADHGFLALTREVDDHMIISKPGGKGELHRRAFVGRGGTTDAASLRLPLSKVGLPGDLDVVVPRGLALIAAGGARGFFHGGLSPQEVLIPVLTVEVPPPQGSAMLEVEVRMTPTITNHIFTGTLRLADTLLSEPVTVSPVPVRTSDEQDVGVLVTAGGTEQGRGLVRLEPGEEFTLAFRVTRKLGKKDKVTLRVFDARTDRMLGESAKSAMVARLLEVDDELL